MIGRDYLTRQAATLLRLARLTRDTRQAVRLAAKAVELQERSDAAPIHRPIADAAGRRGTISTNSTGSRLNDFRYDATGLPKLFRLRNTVPRRANCSRMIKPTVFCIGDRVQLSELGRARSPNMNTTGVVVSVSRTGTVYMVLLDGRVRPVQLHWTYLEAEARTA